MSNPNELVQYYNINLLVKKKIDRLFAFQDRYSGANNFIDVKVLL